MMSFKPLHKDDFLLLYRWFQEPNINQQYARSQIWSLKDIENKYLPRITGHDNAPSFIIYSDNKPIGFIQYYCLSEHYPEGIQKGVTLLLLWYDYRSQRPNGYSYSQYCEHYRRFTGKLKPSMRLTHLAGEKLFVDYSGLTVAWIDKETGAVQNAEVFVAVLGASNL